MREMFDSPGMLALLYAGLESIDATIVENVTRTIMGLSFDKSTASAMLDGHPDLVHALVDTFCNSGVSEQFKCKSQLHPVFPLFLSNSFLFRSDGCVALENMAHTAERAISVLYAHPNLITKVETTTADVVLTDEDILALTDARDLLERFPANVQHAATTRRIIVHRRLAIMAAVRAAQRKKYGEGGQAAPVSDFLEALGDAPGDVLRVIVEFVGEEVEETQEQKMARLERAAIRVGSLKREVAGQRREIEEQRGEIDELKRENEELKGERKLTGRKRGREEE